MKTRKLWAGLDTEELERQQKEFLRYDSKAEKRHAQLAIGYHTMVSVQMKQELKKYTKALRAAKEQQSVGSRKKKFVRFKTRKTA